MHILVSDTSVLIDLERGGLLEAAFNCGLTLIVPDLLYQNELESENGPYLRALGLGVVALGPDEVTIAQAIRAERSSLSIPDCFALSCAMRPQHALVTGDKALRLAAIEKIGVVYGLLWIIDCMEASGVTSRALLCDGLNRIAAHPRCRLPMDEIRSRIANWTLKE